ncbi:SEA domain-containing protein [Caerostris extrusa]|uniref:SEA domain-containing protein n=1 Tax=Caerostris extrusa TaxID=172846 RepID=A0AAV4TC49_CAEEX|nr:SEA domain-containing protein [Caerostris extrusa]
MSGAAICRRVNEINVERTSPNSLYFDLMSHQRQFAKSHRYSTVVEGIFLRQDKSFFPYERLDHLAFTSFPEDYLPYASGYHRGAGKAPPYLVWDERRPRKGRTCCSTAALVSAIALIVTAILAVVAISVYLGVVTNLFRSPVLSLSGKFRVSQGDEFAEELLNTTSHQFLTKADTYQGMNSVCWCSSEILPRQEKKPWQMIHYTKMVKESAGLRSARLWSLTDRRGTVDVDR